MNNDKKAIDKIKAGRFVKNNGAVLRTINMLRYRFVKLSDAAYALDDIPEDEYLDSLNYLGVAEYIQFRHCCTHQTAELADCDVSELEAKLTDKGIRLLTGKFIDELVDV